MRVVTLFTAPLLLLFIRHRKKTRLGYDSLGGKHKGEGKTAVDSPSLYQHKGKPIALSSLPCPAPICEPFRESAIPRGLVFFP